MKCAWRDGDSRPISIRVREYPRAIDAASLLSPFDPVIWFRSRAARLFDFEYRVEIFVPQAKGAGAALYSRF